MKRISVSIRPNVSLPNWSAVQTNAAACALDAILIAFDIETRWVGRDDTEDRVHTAVLLHFLREGHAPSLAALAVMTGSAPNTVRDALGRLQARDMIVLDANGATIIGAYPFTERDTGHRIHLGNHVLNAMCAIDAIGAGAMYNSDTTIESRCAYCATVIRIETTEKGTALGAVMPTDVIVWSGVEYSGGCAANSLCTVMTFFCSDDHLESWRKGNQPDGQGFRLSLDEAQQVGRAMFVPLLKQVPEVQGGAGRRTGMVQTGRMPDQQRASEASSSSTMKQNHPLEGGGRLI